MAGNKNQVKSGFSRYLMLLTFLLFGLMCVWLLTMLFLPFKNILGLNYFTYRVDQFETTTIDGKDIVLNNLSQINVNCKSADIFVRSDTKYPDGGIRIYNNAKGLAKSTDDTEFTYEFSFDESNSTILNIDIHEPEGFIYFANEVEIYFLAPVGVVNTFENTNFNIVSKSGDVYFGSRKLLKEDADQSSVEIKLNNINITKNKGEVLFYPILNPEINNVSISTTKGTVVGGMETLKIKDKFVLKSKSGRFDFNGIEYVGSQPEKQNIKLDLADSQMFVKSLSGHIEMNLKGGHLRADNISGIFESLNPISQMDNAKIKIRNVDANVSLPFANNSNITIDKVAPGKQVYINTTSGDINIKEMSANAWLETTSGDINLKVMSQNDMTLKTTSGDINVSYYATQITDKLFFQSKKGKINVSVRSSLAFVLDARVSDDSKPRDPEDMNIEFYNYDFDRPFVIVNGGTKHLVMRSDGKIYIHILKNV